MIAINTTTSIKKEYSLLCFFSADAALACNEFDSFEKAQVEAWVRQSASTNVEEKKSKKAQRIFCADQSTYFYIALINIATFREKKTVFQKNEALRVIVGTMIDTIIADEKIERGIFIASPALHPLFSTKEFAEIIAIGTCASSYRFDQFITDTSRKRRSNFEILLKEDAQYTTALLQEGIVSGSAVGTAMNRARTWSDMPPSHLFPECYADEIVEFLKESKNISVKVLKKDELTTLGCGGILAVAQGSAHDPRMVIAEYTPEKTPEKTIALVGKGVTFDTGGISIKPSDSMEDMKHDMSGSAVVIGAIKVAAALNLPIKVIACVPLVENMPSGTALRPGDIITFYNKKTAEVKNTDAEGRLILADALAYVSAQYHYDICIDFATLTGACSVALGPFFAAVMSENSTITRTIINAGEIAGERCWELPLDQCFMPGVQSEVADLCNLGKRAYKGGTIIGGCFLSHFVKEKEKWAHIDIANVSYHPIGRPYLCHCHATGFGVYLLKELFSQK